MSKVYTNLQYVKGEFPDGTSSDKAGIRYTKKNSDNEDVVVFVPIVEGNGDYDEIKRQVDAGTLTIEEAD